jgi:galactonate dehydratase
LRWYRSHRDSLYVVRGASGAPEFPDAIADIRSKISLPVCVGERLHSRFMFRPILERQAADIVMPDVARCDGISEMRKIATMCEAYNVTVAPHNPNGPISTIASAHVMASIPNFFVSNSSCRMCRGATQS